MGHNFGMHHDDDCKSASNINREVYSSGCSCFNAFLNPNCRTVITLPNHNTLIIQMDQTLPFKLYSPVLISSKIASFTASSSGPSHFGGEQIYIERERRLGTRQPLPCCNVITYRKAIPPYVNFYWYKHCFWIFFQVALNLRNNTFFPVNMEC